MIVRLDEQDGTTSTQRYLQLDYLCLKVVVEPFTGSLMVIRSNMSARGLLVSDLHNARTEHLVGRSTFWSISGRICPFSEKQALIERKNPRLAYGA